MPDYPLGIDVSNNQGPIDWPSVAAAGVQFCAAKITEGTWFRDGFFQPNWDGMRADGFVRIAYHFGRPDRSRGDAGAIAEANYMVDAFDLLGTTIEVGDCLALDQEQPGISGDYSGWTWAWVQQIADRVGFLPLIYLAPEVIQRMQLYREPRLGQCGLWLASWGVPTPPPAPAPWDLVAIHQTGVGPDGTIPGISGEIDLNRFNGPDVATLKLYGKPASTEPSEPPATVYSVGPGVLALMAEHGEQPGSDELYPNPFWSETMSTSGTTYKWLKANGQTFRYPAG